jgi:hypothetical protein
MRVIASASYCNREVGCSSLRAGGDLILFDGCNSDVISVILRKDRFDVRFILWWESGVEDVLGGEEFE